MEPTLEELFEQFKKLPDWDRYPMPEVFYTHFKVKKPQPATINEVASYTPPAHLPLGDGKVEIRKPAEGGVRQVTFSEPLPVETLLIADEQQPVAEDTEKVINIEADTNFKDQSDGDKKPNSDPSSLTRPTEDNRISIQV